MTNRAHWKTEGNAHNTRASPWGVLSLCPERSGASFQPLEVRVWGGGGPEERCPTQGPLWLQEERPTGPRLGQGLQQLFKVLEAQLSSREALGDKGDRFNSPGGPSASGTGF